jgi:diacylglycerol kinase family enzyme
MVVVGNMRQYALRIDPAAVADPSDGALDVAFFESRSGLGAAWWCVRSRARLVRGRRGFTEARGREVRVSCLGPRLPMQMDGEAFEEGVREAVFTVEPGRLRVLMPG